MGRLPWAGGSGRVWDGCLGLEGVAECGTTALGWREWQSVGRLPWAGGSDRVWDGCLGLEGVTECGTAALGWRE